MGTHTKHARLLIIVGAIPWLMVAELFMQEARPVALTIATMVNWMANSVVGIIFPYVLVSLYHVSVYTMCLFIPCVCLYHVSVYTRSLFMPCVCLYHVSVYTRSLFMPCVCLYQVSVYTMRLFIPGLCLCHVSVYTRSLFIPCVCLYLHWTTYNSFNIAEAEARSIYSHTPTLPRQRKHGDTGHPLPYSNMKFSTDFALAIHQFLLQPLAKQPRPASLCYSLASKIFMFIFK